MNGNVEGKEFAKNEDAVPAKCNSRRHKKNTKHEHTASHPRYRALWDEKGKQKICCYSSPEKYDYEIKGTFVTKLRRVAGSLNFPEDDFRQYPQRKRNPKDYAVYGSRGKWHRAH